MQINFCRSVIVLALIVSSPAAFAAGENNIEVGSYQQVLSLIKGRKLQEAVDLEEKISKGSPKEWLPHAVLSYLYWQEGNSTDAITEGQRAVRCAPANPIALINLAHMHQALEGYLDAIPLYEQAVKADPKNWVPAICLSRCYAKNNQSEKALQVLKEMSGKHDDSFDWNFQLGNAYLLMDNASLAIAAFNAADKVATTTEQKAGLAKQSFLALMRDGQVNPARAMMDDVFTKYAADNEELYVRAAAQLLPPDSPQAGKKLLQFANTNLSNRYNSDAFLRIGKVFEKNNWLDEAAEAFNSAIELNPGQARYHEALAGVLWRQGKTEEAKKELAEARGFDQFDTLAPYLVSLSENNPRKLVALQFEIKGLTCGCQVTKFREALSKLPAVVFQNLVAVKPYRGTVLIDESVMPVEEVLKKCPEMALGAMDNLKEAVSFDVQSKNDVKTVDEAVRVALNATDPDVLQYPKPFDVLPPVLPISLGEKAGEDPGAPRTEKAGEDPGAPRTEKAGEGPGAPRTEKAGEDPGAPRIEKGGEGRAPSQSPSGLAGI